MAGGGYPYQQQGGGHGLKKAEDHGHFPEEELVKEIGSRGYQLKEHERSNLKNIEDRLRSGKALSGNELHDYQHYLEHLSHELKEILQEEHAENIQNIQLERDLRKVAQLMGEVATLLERHN